jgi:CDP-diglyceride synthetase
VGKCTIRESPAQSGRNCAILSQQSANDFGQIHRPVWRLDSKWSLFMHIYDMPIWALFLLTTLLIVGAIEIGYLIGKSMHKHSSEEKESPVSAIAGTVLALLAFILAFTFGIVSDRYDSRKALVREQAITISTAYDRTDFLPSPDEDQAKNIFRQYMDLLVQASEQDSAEDVAPLIAQANVHLEQLWDMGMVHVDTGELNTDIGSLYMDSLNQVGDIQQLRVAVAVQARIPTGLWVILAGLVLLGMIAVGYQTAIAESRRSVAMVILAFSFSIVVCLIAALDNPWSGYLPVSQQPLISVQNMMEQDAAP